MLTVARDIRAPQNRPGSPARPIGSGEEPVAVIPFAPRQGVSCDQAKAEIADLLARQPGCDTFDMALELRLPFSLVESAVEELVREGVLRKGDHALSGTD